MRWKRERERKKTAAQTNPDDGHNVCTRHGGNHPSCNFPWRKGNKLGRIDRTGGPDIILFWCERRASHTANVKLTILRGIIETSKEMDTYISIYNKDRDIHTYIHFYIYVYLLCTVHAAAHVISCAWISKHFAKAKQENQHNHLKHARNKKTKEKQGRMRQQAIWSCVERVFSAPLICYDNYVTWWPTQNRRLERWHKVSSWSIYAAASRPNLRDLNLFSFYLSVPQFRT